MIEPNITPWTHNVSRLDASDGDACVWCEAPIGQPHVDRHGRECFRLTRKRDARLAMIARMHLKCRHDLMPPAEAEFWFDLRNRLIEEMRMTEDYEREGVQTHCADLKDEVDSNARHRALYLHLDEQWDGVGVPPSLSRCLGDHVLQAFTPAHRDMSAYGVARARMKREPAGSAVAA